MPLDIQPELPPLRIDGSGAVRVGNTRVLFVLVVREFQKGSAPEEIARAYDTLTLADTYAAVAYYLRHREEVEALLAEYDQSAEEIRKKIEERQGLQTGLKEKLLRRLAEKQQQSAE